jgi:hypothetical protein
MHTCWRDLCSKLVSKRSPRQNPKLRPRTGGASKSIIVLHCHEDWNQVTKSILVQTKTGLLCGLFILTLYVPLLGLHRLNTSRFEVSRCLHVFSSQWVLAACDLSCSHKLHPRILQHWLLHVIDLGSCITQYYFHGLGLSISAKTWLQLWSSQAEVGILRSGPGITLCCRSLSIPHQEYQRVEHMVLWPDGRAPLPS